MIDASRRLPRRILDGIKDRLAVLDLGAALTGRDATDDVRAVSQHASGVKGPSAPVMPWTKTLLFLSRKIDTQLLPTRSGDRLPRLRPWFRPGSCRPRPRISGPRFRFVPVKSNDESESCALRSRPNASTMPLATSSPRVIPPKMLMNNALTRGMLDHQLVAVAHALRFAPPPTSRKLAISPRRVFDRVHRRHR